MKRYQSGREQNEESVAIGMPDGTWEGGAVDLPEMSDPQISEGTDDGNPDQQSGSYRAIAIGPQDAPAFLRRSFGSEDPKPRRKSSRLSKLYTFIAAKQRVLLDLWRSHFSQGISSGKTERPVGVGGAAFALLSSVVVVTCVGAAIALGQITSLKSEIATLQRELLPLRERLARFEQLEKTKRDLEPQGQAQTKPDTEINQPGGEIRPDQAALNLSREEIQLIKDYIKPAPYAGAAGPAINVGDPLSGAMIPLPSPLTEKIPKLLGAKFAIRNGAIIIVKRDSRQADAVLTPN